MPFYKRYIDDTFGVWEPPVSFTPEESDVRWSEFKEEVNKHCLVCEFTERQMTQQFLDIKLTLEPNGRLSTKLYEKPRALYLFIPPHSAHPPGVRAGHIFGNMLRIFRLSTSEEDIIEDVKKFYRRFRSRGHPEEELKPIFLKAISDTRKYIAKSKASFSKEYTLGEM